ncbi:MAG: DNA alkylation repair protein [Pseudomonadota bacterium]
MTPLEELQALANPQKAEEMARYHKVERPYFGVANPVLDDFSIRIRAEVDLEKRLQIASDLWQSNVHEARVLAAKLLTQARIRPDDQPAWELIQSWVPSFDAWAVADHACMAGQKRLSWVPARLDDVEPWTASEHMWTRRAALVITLPWTKDRHPKPEVIDARERILSWAAGYVPDHAWFIQKAVAWWLRDLSKRDPERVRAFLERYGDAMKPFARREAARFLDQT